MASKRKLKAVPLPEPLVDASMVEVLEDALDLARRGQVRGLAIVYVGAADELATLRWSWRGNWRRTEALGAIETLKHHILEDT